MNPFIFLRLSWINVPTSLMFLKENMDANNRRSKNFFEKTGGELGGELGLFMDMYFFSPGS